MRTLRLIPLLALLSLLFVTCKNDTTEPTLGEGAVSGLLTDAVTGGVVTGATVMSQGPIAGGLSVLTDESGRFLLKFSLDSTATLVLGISRLGYRDTLLTVAVTSGTTSAVTVRLVRTGGNTGGIASVFGVTSDAGTNSPLAGTSVTAQIVSPVPKPAQTALTNVLGEFNFLFSVDTVSIVRVSLARTGYRDTTVYLKANASVPVVAAIGMRQGIGGIGGGSGLPQTIAFVGVTPPELSVYGVGGKETAILDWEVRDSLGNPIDVNHAAQLAFSISNGPGGGEYLSPQTLTTTAAGRASVTFNAGIRSGVAQVVASTVAGGRTITSSPVRVVIDGGFPDQAHFTIATASFNFPAMGVAGMRDQISVIVGDKYSNPAAASAVYFRSSAGVVQGTFGTAVTTKDGQGTVDLISGNPEPLGAYAAPAFGNGYHYVVARTVGQGGVTVQDSLLLLWSGAAMITGINPATFNIPNGGNQAFTFQVQDALGHPLAKGTTINVAAYIPPPPVDGQVQNKVTVNFGDNTNTVVLRDVIQPGPGSTQFNANLGDGSWGVADSTGTPVRLTITVTGPNTSGPVSASINGVVH